MPRSASARALGRYSATWSSAAWELSAALDRGAVVSLAGTGAGGGALAEADGTLEAAGSFALELPRGADEPGTLNVIVAISSEGGGTGATGAVCGGGAGTLDRRASATGCAESSSPVDPLLWNQRTPSPTSSATAIAAMYAVRLL
jgi:hypothetical protein